jgi:hypothetical protein
MTGLTLLPGAVSICQRKAGLKSNRRPETNWLKLIPRNYRS